MLNEFRQDPVSGEWVLFSTARAKKPHPKDGVRFYQSKEECFFEPEKMAQQETPVAIYSHGKLVNDLSADWTTIVVPNKYPSLKKGICNPVHQEGPFTVADGTGFHELVITRDHEKSFAQFSEAETSEVIRVYRDRYTSISKDGCGDYISVFHNHGRLAGASVYHNHSQIVSMPMVPTAIANHMDGARRYFEKTGKRIHDVLVEWELVENKRIIYQNEHFIALCPYVSRAPYEVKIFPKKPSSDFGDISDVEIPFLADALNIILKKLFVALDDVDYVFFMHTAPPKNENPADFSFYQWHLEIMPRISIDAGLELETSVLVNSVDPNSAAELLIKTNV
ncbi:MAG: hypothetical protein A2735_00150 [Candidatus Yanofskybacteria bacterium RIFCSPHIGHO2_01_FULL_41_21]|uniref:DUF4921 domain-containing protein n=1 Tax=Candidatus Yanofskybacteria bacterium RIFCSPHIGHO2_01_FULL_41_21 TaxID=1802660 RepID=A0A1F8ECR8_9BACT|nr:MAG: hypothetical protein A2735_00150 [Candidatus Yanofskybacteria bacterium RIFCSPHIGHO2_01_FULL_41_21]